MPSFNKVVIMGNVTRDVELKYAQSGTAVTQLGLAVNEKRKKGDQWVEETSFVDVMLFGRTAEVAQQYCPKGAAVLIEGKLKQDKWEKDGKRHQKLTVTGDKLVLLGGRQQQNTAYSQPAPQQGQQQQQAPQQQQYQQGQQAHPQQQQQPQQQPQNFFDEVPF